MPSPYEENRIGWFRIGKESFRNYDMVKQIMSQVVVIEANHEFVSNSIKYLAFSEAFEQVPCECLPPFYEVSYERIDLGNGCFTARVIGFEKMEGKS